MGKWVSGPIVFGPQFPIRPKFDIAKYSIYIYIYHLKDRFIMNEVLKRTLSKQIIVF